MYRSRRKYLRLIPKDTATVFRQLKILIGLVNHAFDRANGQF